MGTRSNRMLDSRWGDVQAYPAINMLEEVRACVLMSTKCPGLADLEMHTVWDHQAFALVYRTEIDCSNVYQRRDIPFAKYGTQNGWISSWIGEVEGWDDDHYVS